MTTYDDFTLGWFIGVFEGEGTFTFSNNKPKNICISMTDYDVLSRIRDNFGGSIYEIATREEHWKQAWKWQIMGEPSVDLCRIMLPHLSKRRASRCQEYIDNYSTREMHHARLKEARSVLALSAQALRLEGLTHQEIADRLDVHRSTISKILKLKGE